MNPKPIILAFAWISITALGIHLLSSFWVPLTLGVVATAFLAVVLRK